MKKLFVALALMAAALTTAHAASSNLVQNGSFEATKQATGTWANYANLAGWTGGSLGIELRNKVEGVASNGFNFVELDTTGNSSMSQTINNTSSAGSYLLEFDYTNRVKTAFSTNGLNWQFGNVTGSAPAVSDYKWHTFSQWVKGLDGSTVLKFTAAGKSDSYGSSIDNVKVTPIPGAVWLFGSGLVGLLASQRRKNHTV
jgi:hypothetical protein